MENWGQHLRFAARQLRRNPGFTVTVTVTLVLSIGGYSDLSLVNALMLKACPIAHTGADEHDLREGDRCPLHDERTGIGRRKSGTPARQCSRIVHAVLAALGDQPPGWFARAVRARRRISAHTSTCSLFSL